MAYLLQTLIYWWNWYVFLMHQGCTWQQMRSKEDFLPKGRLVNLELLSLLLSGVFCFHFCSVVEMILKSSLLLWRPATKQDLQLLLWYITAILSFGVSLQAFRLLWSAGKFWEAQKQAHCLSSSKYLSHHCFQSQGMECIEQYRFFQF